MQGQKWCDALQVARNDNAVGAVMRDYVASLPEDVFAVLPAECRDLMRDARLEIPTVAVCLLHAELSYQGSPQVWGVLHEVAHMFALAATRLTVIQQEPAQVR